MVNLLYDGIRALYCHKRLVPAAYDAATTRRMMVVVKRIEGEA